MSEPRVSVVIPHYERPDLLRQAIASVLASSCTSREVVVVDDGSAGELVPDMTEWRDQPVRLIARTGGRKGPSRCRNLGVQAATAELIVFLDSDDIMAPWCLEQRLQESERSPAAELWVFPVLIFEETPGDRDVMWNRMRNGDDDVRRFLRSDPPWHTSSPLWRKAAFLQLGGFNEAVMYGDDAELHVRALLSGCEIVQRPEALPDIFVRRSGAARMTGSITPALLESRRTRLTEITRCLAAADARAELRTIHGGQYFAETEFLLFNRDEPAREIQGVLEQWDAEARPGGLEGAIGKLYLRFALSTRDRAYLLLRIARRIAKLFLPRDWFPLAPGLASTTVADRQMAEIRERLRNA